MSLLLRILSLFAVKDALQPPIWTLMENVFDNSRRGMVCYYDDINNKIIAIGGTNTGYDDRPKFNDSYKIELSGTIPYTVEADSIRFNDGLNGIVVYGETVVKMDNIIYILFGLESNIMNTMSSTITTYDFENNIWNTTSTNGVISSIIYTCVLGLKNYKGIDKAIMAIGGNPNGGGFSNSIYYLDVTVGTWILDSGSLPRNRNLHSCVMINETIYVVGGNEKNILYGNPGTLFETMLNSSNQTLKTYESSGQRSIYVRDDMNQTDLIYIIGGGGSMSDSVEIINIIAREFGERVGLYSLSKAKTGHCLVSDGLRLFVIGGYSGSNIYNEIEYTNTFTTSATLNPTESTLTPTQQTLTPTQSTDPSKIPTATPLITPTLTPTNSPSISCDTIKVTSLYISQNGVNSSVVCTSSIPCDWDLTYKLQNTLINSRPWFKSITNDVNIQYSSNQWTINLDLNKRLLLSSEIAYPPTNLWWTLSINDEIQYQLRIGCSTITAGPTMKEIKGTVLQSTWFNIGIILLSFVMIIIIIISFIYCYRANKQLSVKPANTSTAMSQAMSHSQINDEIIATPGTIQVNNHKNNESQNDRVIAMELAKNEYDVHDVTSGNIDINDIQTPGTSDMEGN